MNQYRITKYNPDKRDNYGNYQDQNEWTDFSDVGKSVVINDYEIIEKAYIDTAIDFITHNDIKSLKVTELEDYDNKSKFSENKIVALDLLEPLLRSLLRGEFWCKLESKNGFIHIGHDFYMYIGVTEENNLVKSKAIDRGLFVEEQPSPYN